MKRWICIAGMVLGVVMVIAGIVVLTSFKGMEPNMVRFGGDFYTESYEATRAAAINLARIGSLLEKALGILLMTLGAGSVLLSLYGYAGSSESAPAAGIASRMKDLLKNVGAAAPEQAAQRSRPKPESIPGSTWACTCGAINPASKGACGTCGAPKPRKPQQADAAPAQGRKKGSPGTWTCFCGAQWPDHRGTCDNCGETKKNVLQPSANAAALYRITNH